MRPRFSEDHIDSLNSELADTRTADAAVAMLAALPVTELRALADLNHIDPHRGREVLVWALFEDRGWRRGDLERFAVDVDVVDFGMAHYYVDTVMSLDEPGARKLISAQQTGGGVEIPGDDHPDLRHLTARTWRELADKLARAVGVRGVGRVTDETGRRGVAVFLVGGS